MPTSSFSFTSSITHLVWNTCERSKHAKKQAWGQHLLTQPRACPQHQSPHCCRQVPLLPRPSTRRQQHSNLSTHHQLIMYTRQGWPPPAAPCTKACQQPGKLPFPTPGTAALPPPPRRTMSNSYARAAPGNIAATASSSTAAATARGCRAIAAAPLSACWAAGRAAAQACQPLHTDVLELVWNQEAPLALPMLRHGTASASSRAWPRGGVRLWIVAIHAAGVQIKCRAGAMSSSSEQQNREMSWPSSTLDGSASEQLWSSKLRCRHPADLCCTPSSGSAIKFWVDRPFSPFPS